MRAEDSDKFYKTGFVAGSFDLFHIGHLNLIRRSKERCEYLIAGVLPDDAIYMRKGKWPVFPLKERMAIVEAIRYVDRVEAIPKEYIGRCASQMRYRFDAFFTGDDYQSEDEIEDERKLNELGADLVLFTYTKEISTTAIQEKTLPAIKSDAYQPTKISNIEYLFPFDKVNKGEKIVVYGVGEVGRHYAAQLSALNFCEIAAFTETYCAENGEFAGFPLVPPERLLDGAWYSRVVIASSRNFGAILARLRSMGIQAERIV